MFKCSHNAAISPTWVFVWFACIQSPYQQPSVIVSPNSFVHRCQAVSVSKIQMSAALNQHPDALRGQAWLHSHRERGLWSTEEGRGQGLGCENPSSDTQKDFHIITQYDFREWIYMPLKKCNLHCKRTHRAVTNSPPLSGSWKFGSRPFSRTFAILSTVPVWM